MLTLVFREMLEAAQLGSESNVYKKLLVLMHVSHFKISLFPLNLAFLFKIIINMKFILLTLFGALVFECKRMYRILSIGASSPGGSLAPRLSELLCIIGPRREELKLHLTRKTT